MLSINNPKYDLILKAVTYFEENNISITKCALKFNIHRETLTKYLKEYGLHKDRRKYDVNENFFEIVDSEEKAYWLGFIVADGCLKKGKNELSIGLSFKDIEHLKKFKQAIESKYPIKIEKAMINDKNIQNLCN